MQIGILECSRVKGKGFGVLKEAERVRHNEGTGDIDEGEGVGRSEKKDVERICKWYGRRSGRGGRIGRESKGRDSDRGEKEIRAGREECMEGRERNDIGGKDKKGERVEVEDNG
ncbi:hypothetical protein KM043_013891 [Ampulex compressa]|nr:hypothetical protein KM043_013891 [Ampulex compressa]